MTIHKELADAFALTNETGLVTVAGDWHGQTGWGNFMIAEASKREPKIILHLGDFGFWPGNSGKSYLHRINKSLANAGIFILVTPGNHEDYIQLSAFQPVEGFEGLSHNPNYPRILLIERGHRWEWAGKKFLSTGGANSIDRSYRIPNLSWWEGEQISLGDVYRSIEGGQADIMLAHDCPAGVDLFGTHRDSGRWMYEDIEYSKKSREALRMIVNDVKPELLFHGHYHFFIDKLTELGDFDGNGYNIRTVGLDKDYTGYNLIEFSIPTMECTQLSYPKPGWKPPKPIEKPWW